MADDAGMATPIPMPARLSAITTTQLPVLGCKTPNNTMEPAMKLVPAIVEIFSPMRTEMYPAIGEAIAKTMGRATAMAPTRPRD